MLGILGLPKIADVSLSWQSDSVSCTALASGMGSGSVGVASTDALAEAIGELVAWADASSGAVGALSLHPRPPAETEDKMKHVQKIRSRLGRVCIVNDLGSHTFEGLGSCLFG